MHGSSMMNLPTSLGTTPTSICRLPASRSTRVKSMRTLMFFDHLLPHLSLIASIAALAYAILMPRLDTYRLCRIRPDPPLRSSASSSPTRPSSISTTTLLVCKLPFYEYGIIWRNLANKMQLLAGRQERLHQS